MRKFFLGCILVGLASVFLFLEEFDIRKLKWGMNYTELRKAEGLESDFYKTEEVLGLKVEVLFNLGKRGLHSVTYSTREKEFYDQARAVLEKKYGAPVKDLDYTYLLQSELVLKDYPGIVLEFLEKQDPAVLDSMRTTEGKMAIRVGLATREVWQYGNTIVLLVSSPEGVVLSYRWKVEHQENKQKFEVLLETLKKKSKKPGEKEEEDVEKL